MKAVSDLKARSGNGLPSTVGQTRSPSEKFGILLPQETILGLFGEYVAPDEQVWSGGLVQILVGLGFSIPSARIALNRVVVRGMLRSVKVGRLVYYTMTPRVAPVLQEGRRQTFSRNANPVWDGKWTLVWYSIPDRHRLERGRLGRWLNFRGFGALQDGTWIVPGNCVAEIRALIRQLGLDEHVIVFTAEAGSSADIQAVIERAWKIGELDQMFDTFVREFSPYRTDAALRRLGPDDALVLRTRLIEMFRQTASQDLHLPDNVIGVRWRRSEAIATFQTIQLALQPRAQAQFRAVTGIDR